MYGVEKNASDKQKRDSKMLQDGGLTRGQAERVTRRQEQRDVRKGNDWIKKNVGLN
jgi:hypothetical protein